MGEGLVCLSKALRHCIYCNNASAYAVGWNDWLYQWIGYADWHYSRTFDITSDQFEGKTVWLKCDGLDTVANVRYILSSPLYD